MERMGDILARTAGQRARQTRPADGNTPAAGAAAAHPTVPLPTRAATSPLSTTRSGWRGRGAPATAASSTRRLTPRPLPPRTGSSGPPRPAPTPAPQADALEAPNPRGVAAVPASAPRPTPADAGGDTLPGDPILELPPRRIAPAARVNGQPPRARVTSPLSATPPPVGAPAANTPSGSGSRMPDANPHRASARPPVTHLREDNAGYVASGATVAAGAMQISIDPHVCPICGGAGYVRLDVPLGDPAFGKPVACACKERQIEERRRSDLRRMSSLDPFLEKTFDAFDTAVQGAREAFEAARTFAADPNGWIVLSGTHGVGKTHLAAAIANMQLAQGTLVFFSIVPDLLDHL
ncbi:MAG TPA: ATP-binding protein, partial [Ktedonobacterales bacterium]|nr:ATP-binding protein [Ktedonobacterales bacterium]